MKYIDKLPRLKLRVSNIMDKAEGYRCLMTYESFIKKTGYIVGIDEEELLILNTKGFIRIQLSDVDKLIEEVEWIKEDIKRRKRNDSMQQMRNNRQGV